MYKKIVQIVATAYFFADYSSIEGRTGLFTGLTSKRF